MLNRKFIRLFRKSLKHVNKKDKKESESRLKRKRARNANENEPEAEFESRPRASDWIEEENDVHYFLPLKADHGRLIHQPPLVKEKPTGKHTGTPSIVPRPIFSSIQRCQEHELSEKIGLVRS